MKFVWVVVFLTAMTTITQAQTQNKTTTPTQAKATTPGKSYGEVARAERNRQLKATPAKTVDIRNASVEKPEEKDVTGAAVKPKTEQQPPEPAQPKPISATDVELAQLAQEKSDLLLQLSNVIRDRKAVDEIQQRLSEIQKRTDELKQPASKPQPLK